MKIRADGGGGVPGCGGFMLIFVAVVLAIALASCATPGRYTGDTEYYWEDGVLHSCREIPERECMKDSDWPDGGLGL